MWALSLDFSYLVLISKGPRIRSRDRFAYTVKEDRRVGGATRKMYAIREVPHFDGNTDKQLSFEFWHCWCESSYELGLVETECHNHNTSLSGACRVLTRKVPEYERQRNRRGI